MLRSLIRKFVESGREASGNIFPPNGFSVQHFRGSNIIVLDKKLLFGNVRVIFPVGIESRKGLLRGHLKVPQRKDGLLFFFSICNSKQKIVPFMLYGLCYCSIGQVILEKFFFAPDMLSVSHLDKFSLFLLDVSYYGPQITQRTLVNSLACKLPSRKDELVYPESDSFFCSSEKDFSLHSALNHLPVHCVSEDTSAALIHFLECYGINDELATYLETISAKIGQGEKRVWEESIRWVLQTKKQ